MIKRGLASQVARFFFNFKQKQPKDAKNINKKPQNKGYLAEAALQENKLKPRLLPPSKDPSKITVVLQLDELLAYTFSPDQQGFLLAPKRKEDFHLWFQQYECLLNIYKRKNLDNFLAYVSEQCEPVLFSKGVKSYVELVMSLIDPTRKIKHIFTQQHCNRIVQEQSDIDEFVKDMNLLGRDMKKVLYIDTQPLSFWLSPQNSMTFASFKADSMMKYEDLDDLILEIEDCRKYQDLRQYLKMHFNYRQEFSNNGLL